MRSFRLPLEHFLIESIYMLTDFMFVNGESLQACSSAFLCITSSYIYIWKNSLRIVQHIREVINVHAVFQIATVSFSH
jgi:hypothetical protein